MLLKIDASSLEWRTYAELSGDPVAIEEIVNGVNTHSVNQERFNLPTRLIAKTFLFRWIYRGSAWAYANDPDFMPTSSDPDFWQNVIDLANNKYSTLYKFQNELIRKVENGEKIVIPSGREYEFKLKEGKNGEFYWPIKDIVNYPNQGFAADLMIIARISLRNRLRKLEEYKQGKIKIFNTIHDDIELDLDNNPELCYNICIIMENVFRDIRTNFKKLYGKDLKVPFAGEVSFGKDLLNLTKFSREAGVEQFYENQNN